MVYTKGIEAVAFRRCAYLLILSKYIMKGSLEHEKDKQNHKHCNYTYDAYAVGATDGICFDKAFNTNRL